MPIVIPRPEFTPAQVCSFVGHVYPAVSVPTLASYCIRCRCSK